MNFRGFSLVRASKKADVKTMKELLAKGASVDSAAISGKTCLMLACQTGDLPSVLVLLEHGAKVAHRVGGCGTALGFAVRRENADIVRALLEHGADPNDYFRVGNEEWPLLVLAAGLRCAEVTKLLLQWGAQPSARIKEGKKETGLTALHCAAGTAHVEILKMLLAAGADPNARVEAYPPTPLWAAVTNDINLKRTKACVEALLEHGADPNLRCRLVTTDRRVDCYTPLLAAAEIGDRGCIKALLAHGADINILTEERSLTAETLAIRWGHLGAAAILSAAVEGKWPPYEVYLQSGRDVRSADSIWCKTAIAWGWSLDETAVHLMQVSGRELNKTDALSIVKGAAAELEFDLHTPDSCVNLVTE